MSVTVPQQEWVLGQLEWHGTGEGHDARCWRRHPACAEAYVSQLQTAIMVLDSDLRRLLDGYDLDKLVDAEVERRMAAMQPKTVERKVEVIRQDPKQVAIVSAVAEWLEATEAVLPRQKRPIAAGTRSSGRWRVRMPKWWRCYTAEFRAARERKRNKAKILDLEHLLAEAFIRRSTLEDELFTQQQLVEELEDKLANANQQASSPYQNSTGWAGHE